MSDRRSTPQGVADHELDVRGMSKPDKHPTIFATFAGLQPGGSFVLINDHDPQPLRREFEVEYADGFDWEYLRSDRKDWRVRITKVTAERLPRSLVDINTLGTAEDDDPAGVLWKLPMRERDLDANVVGLEPNGAIGEHHGPDLDVLVHVLAGSGALETETGTVALHPGQLLWLPRRSRRAFRAGADGLRYLTVHKRRKALTLEPPAPRR